MPYRYYNIISIHGRSLPFMDESALYHSINFDCSSIPEPMVGARDTLYDWSLYPIQETVFSTRLSLLICPSDGSPLSAGPANSYRGNTGLGSNYIFTAEYPDSGNGLFPDLGFVSPARVPDGLSHTVAFSERMMGSGRAGLPQPDRDDSNLEGLFYTADALEIACRIAARPNNFLYTRAGEYWFWSGRNSSLYTHTQSPNGPIPDGLELFATPPPGMATARSYHPGGVNILMGDLSARFVSETISQPVWRGFGTRNGGELVD